MAKYLIYLFFMFFWMGDFYAQKISSPSIVPLFNNADEMMVDDYENVYLYNRKDFSLTKINLEGKLMGRIQLPIPFKIQPITNHFTTILFSRPLQEVRILDQYLNPIQKIKLNPLGNITAAYVQDSQNIWLVDASDRRIIQYDYRQGRVINTTPIDVEVNDIEQIIFFDHQFYLIRNEHFEVYDFQWNLIFSSLLHAPYRLRRANDQLLIFDAQHIWCYTDKHIVPLKEQTLPTLTDTNNSAIYYIKENQIVRESISDNN